MAWWESLLPFGLIIGAMSAAGGVQYGAQLFFEGKPKALFQDKWDRLCIQRDKRLAEEIAAEQKAQQS